MEPCKPKIERADREGKARCCLGCSGGTHPHPGCISAAGAISDLLNGGRNMKVRKHLDDHRQNRSNVYKLLVWQMGAGTAFPHGEMRIYCQI